MGLLPGTYNIVINRLPTSPFGKDLTYDLTVEPFCTLACWNSLKRFDRYSGEYGLVYEHESLETTPTTDAGKRGRFVSPKKGQDAGRTRTDGGHVSSTADGVPF